MAKPIVVLNCGSSSIKFALFDGETHAFRSISKPSQPSARQMPKLANAFTISRPSSRVRVAVEPTNEEWIVGRHALTALR
ncbi:MAG: hypothetical protein ACXWUS_12225 [Burkholderiales bacterium]